MYAGDVTITSLPHGPASCLEYVVPQPCEQELMLYLTVKLFFKVCKDYKSHPFYYSTALGTYKRTSRVCRLEVLGHALTDTSSVATWHVLYVLYSPHPRGCSPRVQYCISHTALTVTYFGFSQ